MADPDPRYPCSSIEDDFNYGSCVASASVHIRMGTFPLPPLPPTPRPGLCGPPCAEPDALLASGGGFQLPPAAPPGAGLAGGARVPQRFRAKPCFPLPAPAPRAMRKSALPREVGGSARLAPPALPGRARLRGAGEPWWSPSCALRAFGNLSGSPARFNPAFLRVERDMKTSTALIWHLYIKRN